MQPGVLRVLEFDAIREALAREAATPLGRDRALALLPSSEADEVQARLALAVEALTFTRAGGSLSLFAPEDLDQIIEVLAIEDQPLEPLALVGLSQCLTSADTVAASIQKTDHARLRAVAVRVETFADEARAIQRAIHPSGEIADEASPALRDIRDKLRRHRSSLRSTLEGLARGRESAKYLQEQIVTSRNGRYVLVVRAEHREGIPGIVHGSSGSGASLYVEPLATVELNNEIVSLVERESEEVRRILLALTDAFRQRRDDLDATLDAVAALDELHAKARLAAVLDARAPALVSDNRLEFLGARHPLLGSPVTPVDVLVLPPTTTLVISGPNTGGKTVALKAAGLLALMAQAGVLIPVEAGSTFTPFRSVFADIGDEQSISASLSTFSARVANIVSMERALTLPALVLLDEVGSGTDPAEGAALGMAVIEHFRSRGALVIATTHDEMLKSYAATTAGVRAAAFGFNAETYAPTYRLLYDAPGRSLALEIAERLGLPASVIADARKRQSGRESQLSAHLAHVDRERAALERDRAALDTDRARLSEARQQLLDREARLTEREAVLKKRHDDRLNDKLREARAEVDRIVGQLKQKADSLASPSTRPLSTGDIGRVGVEGRRALEAVGTGFGLANEEAGMDRLDGPPEAGQAVFVTPFSTEGVVRAVSGKNAEVEIRGKRMKVRVDDLKRPKAQGQGPGTHDSGPRTHRGGVATTVTPMASRELVLIGSTVDEALARAEKFVDDAIVADERRLRVVHGRGTGRLRDALRTFFREHALVAGVAPAPDNEGGDGATIVELKE
jgi:DNA mismatch repair protein MutS2